MLRKVTDYRQIFLLVVKRCEVDGIYINGEEPLPSYSSSETSVNYTSLHGVMSQKAIVFKGKFVFTSNHTTYTLSLFKVFTSEH
jgi:hypothetical protein